MEILSLRPDKKHIDVLSQKLERRFRESSKRCIYRKHVFDSIDYEYYSCNHPQHDFHNGPPTFCMVMYCPILR
jgi:hypothetical protein